MRGRDRNLPPATLAMRLRGLVFILAMYGLMLVMGLTTMIPSLISQPFARRIAKLYSAWVFWLLRVICGARIEIRGKVPHEACIIASKHQSFLDILLLTYALPSARFIMKQSLLKVPILGLFARQIGCIAIDRSAGGDAIRTMIDGVQQRGADAGQTIIFPQGTRTAPGTFPPFRPGVLKLYQHFGQPIVLTALNTGWVWPGHGIARYPATAVLEFLETIPAEQSTEALLPVIENTIETGYDGLADEAHAALTGSDPGRHPA
ncbi:MAG: lysophospholipid acyltransferase family protein [Pseudomonadota bacterium]